MKKFIIRTFIFVLPLFVFLIEGFLPINTFTYRPWEALNYSNKKGVAFPFYPNQNLSMYSTGDLCNRTKYAVVKKENWITDKIGYRNNVFIKKPKVLIIGDSFIAGCSLPQDSTLTNLLMKKLNTEVYNIAPANFFNFISLLKNEVIEKPELIIFSIVERDIPPSIHVNFNENFYPRNESIISIFKDKLFRFYLYSFLKARIKKTHGFGIQGDIDKTMFFMNGKNQQYFYNEIQEISETIISYKDYCDSIGVNFIFLPLPNKETVYFDKVPLVNQPDFIYRLNSNLETKGVISINSVGLFNNERTKNNHYMYHVDDTHWNSNGANIIANELVKEITLKRLIK